MSESGESYAFSLRNDPVFSLRRAKGDTDPPPNTQRLPGEDRDTEKQKVAAASGDLGLPSLEAGGPASEDVRMEYTRPYVVPQNLRGTMPLPGGGAGGSSLTGSGIMPVPMVPSPTPAAGLPAVPMQAPVTGPVAPPPPSNPQLTAPPTPTCSRQPISHRHLATVPPAQQQPASSSNTGTKVVLGLTLVAMLCGTVVVLYMRAQPHADRPAPATSAASVASSPSAAPSETASAAPSAGPSAEPAPVASEATPVASASASAEPTASATPSATASTPPKPRPRPKPAPSATASAGAPGEAPTATAAPTAVPVPLPTPSPDDPSP